MGTDSTDKAGVLLIETDGANLAPEAKRMIAALYSVVSLATTPTIAVNSIGMMAAELLNYLELDDDGVDSFLLSVKANIGRLREQKAESCDA